MNLISAENISKNYADKALFKNLNVGLNHGERVGLIGINGSGKSSLLKILAGVDQPDTGSLSVRKGTSVGFLGQNPVFDEEKTVYENVFSASSPLLTLVKEYEHHQTLDENLPGYHDKMHDLMERMTEANAWNYEQQINEIISRLGIGSLADKKVKLLSGGQRKRIAMAKVLIEEPDVLILDEPTNHLDLETVEWLENIVKTKFQTILLVTHDRYFLDNITNKIIEIDNGQVYRYDGNYAYFLEKKAERQDIKNAEIDKAKNLMRKELDWIRRQPKARGTKAKYRVDAFEDTKATATQKNSNASLELQVKTTRQGGKIAELKKVHKAFGEHKIVTDFTYTFKKGDKIGIIGKNGAGKSTFLNLITGALTQDKGDIDIGETTVFGYYKQEDLVTDADKRLIEVVKDIAEYIEMADGQKISASTFLNMFMFPPADQYKYVGKLSGGERKRLQLLKVLIKNPNFLILDEPTNDLDIGTLNVLEEFLEYFGGTLIIVSHDRYFMDKLVNHLFVFEENGHIRDFPGNYTEFREEKSDKKLSLKEVEEKPKTVHKIEPIQPQEKVSKKISYKEKLEYETLEKELENLEIKKNTLVSKMNDGNINHIELQKLGSEMENIVSEIDSKTMRWLELAELM